MTISRYAAVTDAVLALLRADVTLASVTILDGPPTQGQSAEAFLWIGWSGDPDDATSGSITQAYHDAGPAATRDETVDINCLVQVSRGDDDMAAARTSAIAILGSVETALRANPTLGLTGLLRVELSASSVRQIRDGLGIAVELVFSLTATSLI